MSDRGANIIKALEGQEVLFCFGHRMNNVLQRSFYQMSSKESRESDPAGRRTGTKHLLNALESSDEEFMSDEEISKRSSPSKQPEATIVSRIYQIVQKIY